MLEFVQENLFAPLSDRKDKKDESPSGRLYPPGADPKNTILRFVKRDDKADGYSASMASTDRVSTHRFF
jgi:hypothetical protein